MIDTFDHLLEFENVKHYFEALEKRFIGQALTVDEQKLTREINIFADYDPDLEKQLLKVFLSPVASTFSGLKLLFYEREENGLKNKTVFELAEHYSDMEWKLIRDAAETEGKLYNTLKEKIDHLSIGRIEEGKDRRKFYIEMPLAPDSKLHVDVVRIGTQWLAIPFSSRPVVYLGEYSEEKNQTRFKSLRLKLEDLKNKGVFNTLDKIVIKGK